MNLKGCLHYTIVCMEYKAIIVAANWNMKELHTRRLLATWAENNYFQERLNFLEILDSVCQKK